MPKNSNYLIGICLFTLVVFGSGIQSAKADYVDYVNGVEVLVRYNDATGNVDIVNNETGAVMAADVTITRNADGRGIPNLDASSDVFGITPPGREGEAGITDSSERAEDYSCSRVNVCGTTVIGYSANPQNPNYALYSDTNMQEVATIFLRDSGQATGTAAWEKAGADGYTERIDMTVDQVNNFLKDLGANFRITGKDGSAIVTRMDLLNALAEKGDVEEGVMEGIIPEEPGENVPPPVPEVSIECAFSALPTEILYSKTSKLNWSCNKTAGCKIQDEFGATVLSSLSSLSGDTTVTPLKSTKYFLNCPEGKSWSANVRVFSGSVQ